MNTEESTPTLPDEQVKPPEEKKKFPYRGIFVFSIGAAAFVLAVAGLVVVSQFYRESEEDTVAEGTEETLADDVEEDGDEVEDEDTSEIVEDEGGEEEEEEEAGVLMVYTKGDELRLLYSDGTSIKIDDLVDPYENAGYTFSVSSPNWSPDGTKILYASGLDLKVYDMVTETSSVLYTGHASGMSGTTVYSVIRKYGWKDDDEILFVNDAAESVTADMKDIHTVTLLNIGTLATSDWGTYDMDTGFGGASSDPADWMMWHFSDLLGLSDKLYYYDNDVYIQTRIGSNTWVQIPQGGTHTPVADSVVETIAGTIDYDMVMTPGGEYESDASIQDYVLDAMGSAPAYFQYYNSVISQSGIDIVVVDAHGLWNLQEDADGGYLYYTEIENSHGLATALDDEVPAVTIENYYPTSNIKKINLDTNVVETVVEGFDFDLR